MGFKTEEALDSSIAANELLQEIRDIESAERFILPNLSSEDLFKIDCGILSSLKKTQDFSRDLINFLEKGEFETFTPKKDELKAIQQEVMVDITKPLENMFNELIEFV